MEETKKQQATRVFKKSSPNGKITVYLGKRDFVDHGDHVDPIDGVVLVDPEYINQRKVFGSIHAVFRYGREDLDVLGLTFRKDLFTTAQQIYPELTPEEIRKAMSQLETLKPEEVRNLTSCPEQPKPEEVRKPTRLQERLLKKLGPHAFPFCFQLPPSTPTSVTLQPGPADTGKPCGVDYELKAFVAESVEDKAHRRNSVRLAIRKIMYAPSIQGEQPSVEVSKEFMMSPSKLHLEASLDKELYYHGESINVNVHVANNSNRTVKKVKVAVRQFADICIFSMAQYKCTVAEIESDAGCPVGTGFTLSKVYTVKPVLQNNKDKRGLALDGQLKHEDTNLASSTILTEGQKKENLGIIVQYKVKVRLCLGPLGGDVVAELPFTLMHPKPEEEEDLTPTGPLTPNGDNDDDTDCVVENLIQLDDDDPDRTPTNEDASVLDMPAGERACGDDDDIIFEDFARFRLKKTEGDA